jgi:SAM-dependent methyltransferase
MNTWDIEALNMDDVYSSEYTDHIRLIREQAALVLARVALKHLFADGTAQFLIHDPDEEPPKGVQDRQPFFFRKRLIEYLYDRGDLRLDDGDRCVYWLTDELVSRARTPEAEHFATTDPSMSSPTLGAMKHIESIVGGVLQGQDGLELLEQQIGEQETWRIWQYLMVDAAPKKACNSLVARALDLRLRSGEPTVVFEGGAGLGATLREALLIDGFRARASNITSYGFTDINRPLMRRAREMVAETAPELLPRLHFDRVDLDQLDDYDDVPYLQTEAVDVVIFESVLHDVENLHSVLTSCRRILKPGGWLAFTIGSRGRPGQFFPCELLQSTLHSYYRAELDPPRRVNVGYLSITEWSTSLVDAGFSDFRVFPEISQHATWPYGGIVARRP